MHVLITNHAIEQIAFRHALGDAATTLQIVENNLSALSLLGSNPGHAQSLTITEHQDEGVNVDTRTFVRNLVARSVDSLTLVIVGQLFADLEAPGVHIADTIDDAAAIVRELAELVPVATVETEAAATIAPHTNGHASYDADTTVVAAPSYHLASETVVPPAAVPSHEAEPDHMPSITAVAPLVPEASIAIPPPTPVDQPPSSQPHAIEQIPETTRSLADDIRDWTELNEAQRQRRSTSAPQRGLMQRLGDMMPAARRARAEEAELDKRIRAPRLSRCHSIAVISPKGGVGKSFLTYVVGNFLAEVRGDKVIAIDTNPDFGTLADQVRGREPQTISTLLDQINRIEHYSDLRRFTSKVESRLEVLAAPADPDVMASISANDYARVFTQLHHYYDTVLFDCGTGFRDDITRFALQQCDQIVLVSAPLFITTGIVIRALGYLNQIGCDLSRVTLAINQVRQEKPLDLEYMRSRFGDRLNAIIEVPFDMQLYREMDTGEFSVERTLPATRTSVKRLVAELVNHFE